MLRGYDSNFQVSSDVPAPNDVVLDTNNSSCVLLFFSPGTDVADYSMVEVAGGAVATPLTGESSAAGGLALDQSNVVARNGDIDGPNLVSAIRLLNGDGTADIVYTFNRNITPPGVPSAATGFGFATAGGQGQSGNGIVVGTTAKSVVVRYPSSTTTPDPVNCQTAPDGGLGGPVRRPMPCGPTR